MIAPFFIIIGIFVAVGVISSVAKSSKKAKEEDKKKQGLERVSKMLEEKEDFKKFLDYESSSSQKPASSRAQQPAPQQQRRREEARPIADGRVQAKATQKHTFNTIQPRVDAKKEVSGSHHQSHCDTQHGGDKYRVEYVPTMNSIGGTSTEGCQEHYNTRYVKIDEKIQENLQLTPLQKIIVYGEVINKPKFRR